MFISPFYCKALMCMTLLLVMANMLTFPLQAVAKLPSATVRRAVGQAIRAGDANGLAAVLERHGLQVNAVIGAGGFTLLHDAVVEGTPEVVTYLLASDAQVNATLPPLMRRKRLLKQRWLHCWSKRGRCMAKASTSRQSLLSTEMQ